MDRKLARAYRESARRTRVAGSNFYYAFLTLPRHKRRAIYAIYSFCRAADEIADGPAPLPEKRDGLTELRHRLKAAAGSPEDGVDLSLADAIARFSVDVQDLAAVIDGVEMDLTKSRYDTFTELSEYCYRVASAVGLAVLPVLNGGPVGREVRERGIDLGIGLQLANIVRDVGEDAARGRIYIPREDLARFGVGEAEVLSGTVSARMRALLSFEAGRARERIERGLGIVPALPRHARPFPLFLGRAYRRILARIEERGYDVFTGFRSLSPGEKIRLLVSSYLRRS